MSEAVLEWVRRQVRVVDITAFRHRPWASVWRIEAADGLWWLKVNSPATGYEARLLAVLGRSGSGLLPASITHPAQPWALVADAGQRVRELLADAEPAQIVSLWCELMPRYAALQKSLTATELISVGVPDYSPARAEQLFDALVADVGWFSAEIAPDYSERVHRRVSCARPRLVELAAELAGGLAPTVQHDDLHDGNVLGPDPVRIIDWGDAVVAHPFATLRITLDSLAARLELPVGAAELIKVRDAYLEVWRTGGESSADLVRQVELARRLAGLGRAGCWIRALGTPDVGRELGFADAVAGWTEKLADDVLGA